MTRILLVVDPRNQATHIIEDPRLPRDVMIAISSSSGILSSDSFLK